MPTKNAHKIKSFGYAILFAIITSALVFAQTPAPLGIYKATTGSSMVKGQSAAVGEEGGFFKKDSKSRLKSVLATPSPSRCRAIQPRKNSAS